MTSLVPLQQASAASVPSFVRPSSEVDLQTVSDAIKRAKRVVVVCGAGISVAAGIPDFRSADGLFKTLKNDNPQEALSSGKDLFDARVFNATQSLALFNRMIARLHDLASAGSPTAFHALLRSLNERSKLLRVYTQNIDALEEKAGLSLGAPVWPTLMMRTPKKPASQGSSATLVNSLTGTPLNEDSIISIDSPSPSPSPPLVKLPPLHDSPTSTPSRGTGTTTPKTPSRRASPFAQPFQAPRCVAVHGTLKTFYCVYCSYSTTLAPHAAILADGDSVLCPQCAEFDSVRRAAGKRERGVGRLRPAVVLYGEEHKEGEAIGECVRRDLTGLGDLMPGERAKASARPDLLIVAGTSLQVPGTKRIVKEFAKAVRPSLSSPPTPSKDSIAQPDARPATSVRKTAPQSDIRTIYVNYDFPAPAREWEGVFDVWVQGDAQVLAAVMQEALKEQDRELLKSSMPTARTSRKRKRSEPVTPTKSLTKKSSKSQKSPTLLRSSKSYKTVKSPKSSRSSKLATPMKSPKPAKSSKVVKTSKTRKSPTSTKSPKAKKSPMKAPFSSNLQPTPPRPRLEVYVDVPPSPKRRKISPATPSTPAKPKRPAPKVRPPPVKEVSAITATPTKERTEPRMETIIRTVQLGLRQRSGTLTLAAA